MGSINRGLKSFVNKLFLKKFNNIFMRNINKNKNKKKTFKNISCYFPLP